MIGRRFNILVVIKEVESKGNGKRYECLCDCGKTCVTQGTNLRAGVTRSCGCLRSHLKKSNSLDIKEVVRLYHDESLDSIQVGKIMNVSGTVIRNMLRENGIVVRGKGEATSLRAMGRIVERHEYLAIKTGENRHGTMLHRYLIEQHLGRKLGGGEVVHHVNGDKRDNRLENLRVMTRSDHTSLHRNQKGMQL
jgi:hypothetical protein